MYPDAVRPIYFLSDREDSQAYHLKWWKLQLMHLYEYVSVEILAAVMWPRGVLYAPPVGSRVSPGVKAFHAV